MDAMTINFPPAVDEDLSFRGRLPAGQRGLHEVEEVGSDGKADLGPARIDELRDVALDLAGLPAKYLEREQDLNL